MNTIHRLKITLDDVEPPLWRLLEIESDCPIDFVADAIRGVFGWSFTHGYKFVIKGRHYGTHNHWVRDDPEQELEERRRHITKRKLGSNAERKAMDELFDWYDARRAELAKEEDPIPMLSEVVRRARSRFRFIFDFGDWWEHTVIVEKIEPADPSVAYPRCIGGSGANPLEDCGGWWRLNQVIQAVDEPKIPRDETLQHIITNWVGENWDHQKVSVDEINMRLRKMFTKSELE